MINYKAIISIFLHEIEEQKELFSEHSITNINSSLYFIIFGSANQELKKLMEYHMECI